MVGLSTIVYAEIRNCSNIQEVRPSVVLDAVGDVLAVEGKSYLFHYNMTLVINYILTLQIPLERNQI